MKKINGKAKLACSVYLLIVLSSITPCIVNAQKKIKTWVVDDYSKLPAKWFRNDSATDGHEKVYKGIHSPDQVWFINDSLQQSLVFMMGTDDFHEKVFIFLNNDIPMEMVKEMELITDDHDPATNQSLKLQAIKHFLKTSKKISPKYFKSDKGLRLGEAKETLLKMYGQPDKTTSVNGIETMHWEFTGDIGGDTEKPHNVKRYAKDSFGHQLTLCFRSGKLIAMVLSNDEP